MFRLMAEATVLRRFPWKSPVESMESAWTPRLSNSPLEARGAKFLKKIVDLPLPLWPVMTLHREMCGDWFHVEHREVLDIDGRGVFLWNLRLSLVSRL